MGTGSTLLLQSMDPLGPGAQSRLCFPTVSCQFPRFTPAYASRSSSRFTGANGRVEGVDRQRQADGVNVHANLVRLAGFWEEPHEREVAKCLFNFPIGSRGFAEACYRSIKDGAWVKLDAH